MALVREGPSPYSELLDQLQAGDNVRFTIDTQPEAIVKIEKLHK
jgi:hypothetical protein